jgi:hypothetical protein
MYVEISVKVGDREYGGNQVYRRAGVDVASEEIARAMLMHETATGHAVVVMLIEAFAELAAFIAEEADDDNRLD